MEEKHMITKRTLNLAVFENGEAPRLVKIANVPYSANTLAIKLKLIETLNIPPLYNEDPKYYAYGDSVEELDDESIKGVGADLFFTYEDFSPVNNEIKLIEAEDLSVFDYTIGMKKTALDNFKKVFSELSIDDKKRVHRELLEDLAKEGN